MITAFGPPPYKIDLGCGTDRHDGYVRVDIDKSREPDICADIRFPIPGLADGCAEHVLCAHVLEHLPGNNYLSVLNEITRLLRRGGTFEIRVPHPSSDCAMVHNHIHVHTPRWWHDMHRGNWLRGRLIIDDIQAHFDPQFLRDRERYPEHFPEALNHYLRNVYDETSVKGHKP